MAVYQDKRGSTLWMGDLEPEMDEAFVATAFLLVNEPVAAVRIIKNRLTGDPAGYCFVEFNDEEQAQRALLRLNGKPIPGNLNPPRRFKLNPSVKPEPGEEYSVFVGDLTDDVDDYDLYKTFKDRYPSTKGAKVVLESNGESRGFGFVRFSNNFEQMAALKDMQFHSGLGSRPIRVSSAMPKRAWPGAGSAGSSHLAAFPGHLDPPQPSFSNSPPPFEVPFNHIPGAPMLPSGPKDVAQPWQQQWLHFYQQWQQYYLNQAQWAEYNQSQGISPPSKKEQSLQPPGFDVVQSNEEKLRVNREFEDEMQESQWFSHLLGI